MDAEMMIIISEQRDAARFKSGARCGCYVCAISSFGPFSGYLNVWLSMIEDLDLDVGCACNPRD